MKKCWLFIGIATVLITLTSGSTFAASDSGKVWTLNQTVDEFGDVTEDSETIIQTSVEGTFSNTATTDAELTVNIAVYPQEYMNRIFPVMAFDLLEYSKQSATFLDNSNKRILFKIGEEKEEHYLTGKSPNGNLYLSNNSDKAYAFETTGKPLYKDSGFSKIAKSLYEGNDVKCIIYIDSSSYHFTISSSNFAAICDEIGFNADPSAEDIGWKAVNSYFDTYDYVQVLEKQNYNYEFYFRQGYYAEDAYSQLQAAITDGVLPVLTPEEIGAEMSGDWAAVPIMKDYISKVPDPEYRFPMTTLSISENGDVTITGTYQDGEIIPGDASWGTLPIDTNTSLFENCVQIHNSNTDRNYALRIFRLSDGFYLCVSYNEDGSYYDGFSCVLGRLDKVKEIAK